MNYILIGLALMLFIGALNKATTNETMPNNTQGQNIALVEDFIVYRNAVEAYVLNNPGFTGTVQLAALALPAGTDISAFPKGISNAIVSDGSGGFYIYAWAAGNADVPGIIDNLTQGDLTIGYTVSGGQWMTAETGNMGTTPSGVPAGDIFSVLKIGS